MSFFKILVAEGFGGRLDEGGGSSARANQIESIEITVLPPSPVPQSRLSWLVDVRLRVLVGLARVSPASSEIPSRPTCMYMSYRYYQ